jgi:uncharacterized membrane protein YebE (DUF533 family)
MGEAGASYAREGEAGMKWVALVNAFAAGGCNAMVVDSVMKNSAGMAVVWFAACIALLFLAGTTLLHYEEKLPAREMRHEGEKGKREIC